MMDFTSTSLADKPGSGIVVQDCIIVMEYKDQNNQLVRRNIDLLCASDTNKHDFHFVFQVWINLFFKEKLDEKFDRIDLWTDGGPHHFKTRWCQFTWHSLSTLRFHSKPITHHFFPSYHGHSLVDGHAAIIKRALNTRYNESEFERATHAATATWGPASISDVKLILEANCKNGSIVFDDIDRDPANKPDITPVPSIKIQHSIRFMGGECAAFKKTGDAVGTEFVFRRQ